MRKKFFSLPEKKLWLAKEIAQREGLDGQPLERYIKLVNEHRGNLRAVLQAVESGAMQATGDEQPRADE